MPLAISTSEQIEVLRLLVPVPVGSEQDEWTSWGMSLGYALLAGMQHFFMLGSGELDFELEGPWQAGQAIGRYGILSLTFIDPSLGGSGYLGRIAEQFHQTASQAIEHLDHPGCETACYRCLKSYYNQRYHQDLKWPQVMPALEELAQAAPSRRPLETGDIDDPRPWLEAYAAGVGSPLELKFLRLFERNTAFTHRSNWLSRRTLASHLSRLPILPFLSGGWPSTSTARLSTSASVCGGTDSFATGCGMAIHRGGWRN